MNTQLKQLANLFGLQYTTIQSSVSWEGLPTTIHSFLHTSKDEYGGLHFVSLTFVETDGWMSIMYGTPDVFPMSMAADKLRVWCNLYGIMEGNYDI